MEIVNGSLGQGDTKVGFISVIIIFAIIQVYLCY